MRRILLTDYHCPGDTLEDTAAVHELRLSHPDIRVMVRTTAQELWDHNPEVEAFSEGDGRGFVERIPIQMPLIHRSNQCGLHVIDCIRRYLEDRLQVKITPQERKATIYLTDEERECGAWLEQCGIHGPFWLVNAGHKSDYPVKYWGFENFQKVIDMTRHAIQWVQVGATEHTHRPLAGVIDMVGKTTHRQLAMLTHHADGVLTGVSYLMHMATIRWYGHGQTRRPVVVINGGREPDSFSAYPGQHRFSSVGLLDCCRNGGCWRSTVTGDGPKACAHPAKLPGGEMVPLCMAMIRPEAVAERILAIVKSFGASPAAGTTP